MVSSPRRAAPGMVGLLLVTGFFATMSGCVREYQFERPEAQRGTLGQELFFIWRKDAVRAPEKAAAKVELLDRRHADFVAAVDAAAPQEELWNVDAFLQRANRLVDEGLLPGMSRKVRTALEEARDNPALLGALSTYFRPRPESFVTPNSPPNFLGHLTGYEQLPAWTARAMDAFLESDGLTDTGAPDLAESSAMSDLLRAWKGALQDPEVQTVGRRLAMQVRDVLLVEDARYAPSPDTPPLYAALYDDRGFPRARKTDQGVAFPFDDRNGDGMADIDGEGRFMLRDGSAARIPAFSLRDNFDEPFPRDQHGRAGAPGQHIFDYFDLNRTGLGFLLGATARLSREHVLYHMMAAAPGAMGPRAVHEDDFGSYVGFDANHPLLDVVHALIHILDIDELPEILESSARFLDLSMTSLAKMADALQHAAGAIERYPEAHLHDDQTLLYDLLPLIGELSADPELWADVMKALRDPIVRRGSEAMLTLLMHKDTEAVPALDGPYDRCFQTCRMRHDIGTEARFDCIRQCPNDEIFATPMDFSAPESPQNRSMFQRLFHLLRDTAGVPYALRIEESRIPGITLPELPPIVELPGAAEAYVRAIAGELHLADYMSDEFTDGDLAVVINLLNAIPGVNITNDSIAMVFSMLSGLFGTHLDVVPTPDQITRLFNQPDLRFETDDGRIMVAVTNPVCRDGFVMARHHADGLFAAEASGLIDTLYPLTKAFAAHDREELLTRIFVIVHDHYSSRNDLYRTASGGLSTMKGANLVSYERAIRDILEDGRLFVALQELSLAMDRVKSADDVPFEEHLRRLVYQATRTDDGFRGRQDVASIELPDGRTVSELSRLHLVLDGLDEVVDRLDDDPEAREHLKKAVSGVFDALFTTEAGADAPRFQEPGVIALTSHVSRHLASEARKMRDRGELSRWLTVDQMDNIAELFTSRGFVSLIDFANLSLADEQNRELTDDFIQHLLGNTEGREQMASVAFVALVRSVQTEFWVPVARFLSGFLDPDRVWVDGPHAKLPVVTHFALLLKRTAEVDPEGVGFELFHRGLDRSATGEAPFGVLADIIGSYWRPDPSSTAAWSAEDFQQVFDRLAGWLGDPDHGLERFFKLVAMRKDAAPANDWN